MRLPSSSRRRLARLTILTAAIVAAIFSTRGTGVTVQAAAPLTARAVPWKGDPTTGHPVYSGGQTTLQGVATLGINDATTPLTFAQWDPGDGSPAVNVPLGNSLVLELVHTYSAAAGTPFVATLTVKNVGGETATATQRIIVEAKTLDVERDMAIDKGLWYLHKNISRTTIGAFAAGFWPFGGSNLASTSSAVQAYEVNGHRESSDAAVDPYQHDASRGLVYLQNALQVVGIGLQPAGNPDVNGNTYALFAADGSENYITGQVVDAFVASGTPNALAVVGDATHVRGRQYIDIVEDMMEFSYWGQNDPACGSARGSWDYTRNTCRPDNSTAQWPAIGGIAAQRVWHLNPPSFVLDENKMWLHNSQALAGGFSDGQFGYTNSGCVWSDCQSTTPSGLVQFIYDGARYNPAAAAGSDDDRFVRGVRNIAREMRTRNNFPGGALPGSGTDVTWGGQNFYTLYATTKALRLALNAAGTPAPIGVIDDNPADATPGFDWYRNDPLNGDPQPYGMARSVIATQQLDGHWNGVQYWTNPLSTEYAILILSPTLFEQGPKAQCQATPNEVGSGGGSVSFTSTGTVEQNPDPTVTIVSYTWHFDDGSPDASGASTAHTYGPGGPTVFTATLTVTDSNGNTDTKACPVTRTDTDVKPNADLGSNTGVPGEYLFCKGTTLILDGSASSDPDPGDSIASYEWDITAPLTFTPADSTSAMFDATAAFTARAPGVYDMGLRVTDTFGKSDAKFGHVTVKDATDPACNQPPVANDDTFSVNEDNPLSGNVQANDTDDHGITSSALVSGPAHGALVFNADGTFTYTPAANYCGPDSFRYTDSDGQYTSNVATAGINVVCVNDPPVANNDTATTDEDTAVSGNVLANDSDADGDALSASLGSGPAHGTVVLNADGTFTYTPNANYCGPDSFTYNAEDGHGGSTPASVSITVNCVNDAPVANNDSATTNEDTPVSGNVLANDTDADGDTLTASLVTGPAHGTLSLNGNGTFTFTPAANYCGPDGFTYSADDGHGGSAAAAVSLTVNCVNDAPVANNDSAVTNEDTPVAGNVLTNDSDADGDVLTASLVTGVSHGTLVLNPNGTYVYTPALNYNGPDSFTYQVSDGHGGTAVATVSITVLPVNDAPVCSAVVPSISEIWPPNHQMVPVTLSGATDIEGDGVSFTVTGIYQDEPTNTVGDGNTAVDAGGIGTATAQVRAERSGTPRVPGNGRVYHIQFTGSDGHGGSCTGEVRVGVPHDQGNQSVLVDDGIKYNSVTGAAVP